MVIHIGKQQPPQPMQYQPQPVQPAQPRVEDNRLKELEEQNRNLENINYFNGLSDEKTFRFELLQAINRVALVLNSLNEKIVELTQPQEAQEVQQ